MRKTITRTTFDSMLDTDRCNTHTNAQLTLTLKIGFRQINPAGGAATGTYTKPGGAASDAVAITKWAAADWEAWKLRFSTTGQTFWDAKFWLTNNTGKFAFSDVGLVFVPDVDCRFVLSASDFATAGLHHRTVDVLHLDAAEPDFGSNTDVFDNLDMNTTSYRNDSAGHAIQFQTHYHEIGHFLGLGHVDEGKPHCLPGNTNADACYGVADNDLNSVMGAGMRVDVAHAKAWLGCFAEHAAAEAASPLYAPPAAAVKASTAHLDRSYPRVTAEFEAGTRITTPVLRIAPRLPAPAGGVPAKAGGALRR